MMHADGRHYQVEVVIGIGEMRNIAGSEMHTLRDVRAYGVGNRGTDVTTSAGRAPASREKYGESPHQAS